VTPFDVANPDSWPAVMTASEVAAIFRRKVGGLKRAIQRGQIRFPMPYQTKPYLWRRADVVRFVESGRGSSLRRAG
jgi:hypothetical protein